MARETVNQMDAIFATAFNFLCPATIDRIKSAQDVADWGCVLVRMGLGSDVGSIPRVHPHAWPWLASVPSVADGLLFRVPTPLGGPWPNRSLGDALAWHLANRKHIETMQVEGLALVIFSASALVAGSHLFTTSEHGRSPASELLVEAIEWFLRQLPTVDPNSRQGAVLK